MPKLGRRKAPPAGWEDIEPTVSELDRMLLRVAVANINTPELLVVGNLDKVTSDKDRDVLVERLAMEVSTLMAALLRWVSDGTQPTPASIASQLPRATTSAAPAKTSQTSPISRAGSGASCSTRSPIMP